MGLKDTVCLLVSQTTPLLLPSPQLLQKTTLLYAPSHLSCPELSDATSGHLELLCSP